MLSVMYALLEALSAELDIERNDIKGCLHKVILDNKLMSLHTTINESFTDVSIQNLFPSFIILDNKLMYSVVLYDAVAGGAGHVRRLVTESGDKFRQVVVPRSNHQCTKHWHKTKETTYYAVYKAPY
mgnify:CR=1 FL=1